MFCAHALPEHVLQLLVAKAGSSSRLMDQRSMTVCMWQARPPLSPHSTLRVYAYEADLVLVTLSSLTGKTTGFTRPLGRGWKKADVSPGPLNLPSICSFQLISGRPPASGADTLGLPLCRKALEPISWVLYKGEGAGQCLRTAVSN